MERYSLVLLVRPGSAPEYDEQRLEEIQRLHLEHLGEMRRLGHLAAAGPVSDQDDPALRGICLYRTGVAETRELASGDPAVRAGRLAVKVMTWLVPEGQVSFDQPAPQDDASAT